MHMRQTSSPPSQELRNSTDSHEPGENATLGEKKQTVIHQLFKMVDLYQLHSTGIKKMIDNRGQNHLQRSNGMSGGWALKDFHPAHIWNIQFHRSTVVFSKFSLNYPLCNTIIWRIITCSLGDLGFSFFLLLKMTGALPREQPTELIPDNLWCTSYTTPRPPRSSLTFLQINFKGKGRQPLTSEAIQTALISSEFFYVLKEGFSPDTFSGERFG